MKDTTISDSIFYVGADDTTLDLFESQYIVPEGVSYNSYVIMDDKITIMDTVDQRATEEWIANVKNVLKDKTPAYLVVSHMEPDHAANIQKIAEMYPEMKIIGNAKTFSMMPQFFDFDLSNRSVVVKEGEEISKILALIGANKAVMKFEEIRIQREMRGKVNRLVNCKTANLNKTINASVEQIAAINKLKENGKFNKLNENLKEIAELRIENPDMSLIDLGKLLKEPVGKSGVNYRLKKIIELAND